jgi:DNA-binding transcriptional LysR family regulator
MPNDYRCAGAARHDAVVDEAIREQRVELRHLRAFVALAEELHYGRTAMRLHIAQPAVTRQIQQLEAALGLSLLSRTTRGVKLTDAGRGFLVEARRVLAQVDRAYAVAESAGRGETGRIRVGFSAAAPNGVFPHVINRFRARFPEVAVELHELWSSQQQEALVLDRIDVGFAQRPTVESDLLATEDVQEDPIVAVVHRGDRLAGRDEVALRELRDSPFILFPRGLAAPWFDEIVAACRDAGFSPRVVQEAVGIDVTLGLVAAGLGVALLPASVRTLQREDVVYVALAEPVPAQRTAVVWRRDDPSPVVERFLEVARSIAIVGPA